MKLYIQNNIKQVRMKIGLLTKYKIVCQVHLNTNSPILQDYGKNIWQMIVI
jgi:hypothetical protein